MEILSREGGIYLDTDVYVLKSFTDLLNSPRDILLGHEGGNRYGLCNAVIVSRPGSRFMEIWRESYEKRYFLPTSIYPSIHPSIGVRWRVHACVANEIFL